MIEDYRFELKYLFVASTVLVDLEIYYILSSLLFTGPLREEGDTFCQNLVAWRCLPWETFCPQNGTRVFETKTLAGPYLEIARK